MSNLMGVVKKICYLLHMFSILLAQLIWWYFMPLNWEKNIYLYKIVRLNCFLINWVLKKAIDAYLSHYLNYKILQNISFFITKIDKYEWRLTYLCPLSDAMVISSLNSLKDQISYSSLTRENISGNYWLMTQQTRSNSTGP